MGIRTSSGIIKGKEEVIELSKEMTTASRSNKPRRTRRRRQGNPPPPPVQTLFNTCKEMFADAGFRSVPKPDDVVRLCSIMNSMKATDAGLSPDMVYFRGKKLGAVPVIGYLHLHECEKFTIGIFCLPSSAVIPLHSHPGMTVFSKLLFGTLHIKSYDWEADVTPNKMALASSSQNALDATTARLAKLKVNSEFTAPCDTTVLYPNDGGNLHCLTAVTPCAILDILTPPYSDPDGRHCTYYREFPLDHFSAEGVAVPESEKENYAWLEEKERPDDLIMIAGRYTGPKIIKT